MQFSRLSKIQAVRVTAVTMKKIWSITILVFLIAAASANLEQFRRDCLEAHNNYRRMHGVPPLALNREISSVAQRWAEHIAARSTLQHSKGKYGENLYVLYTTNPSHQLSGKEAVDSWYAEIKKHTFGTEPTSLEAGHFTQVVWKDSKQLGVGMAKNSKGHIYVVCNYDPPGNFVGRYNQNVLPPSRG